MFDMCSIHVAAAHLMNEIAAPQGAINTLAYFDAEGPLIRVLIDPAYWLQTPELPTIYEGYRVVVERRVPSFAFH